jgi:hypothetical protein
MSSSDVIRTNRPLASQLMHSTATAAIGSGRGGRGIYDASGRLHLVGYKCANDTKEMYVLSTLGLEVGICFREENHSKSKTSLTVILLKKTD